MMPDRRCPTYIISLYALHFCTWPTQVDGLQASDDHAPIICLLPSLCLQVRFFVNGDQVRSVPLSRPLKAMQLEMSVWTTMGGW